MHPAQGCQKQLEDVKSTQGCQKQSKASQGCQKQLKDAKSSFLMLQMGADKVYYGHGQES